MGVVRTRVRKAAALAISIAGVLIGSPSAFGLNPALDVSLYAHTPWKIREGSFKGVISAMAQTRDGYLWLGTEYGVVRFDGVRFISWQPPEGQQPPNIHVKSLLAARDGSLWIGTSEGLARWSGGHLKHYAEFAGKSVGALLEDREGVVWAGAHLSPSTRLCAIHTDGAIQCFGGDGVFGQTSSESPNATFISSLYEDRAANLWVGGVEGLWRWKPGPPRHFAMPDRVQALVENDPGGLGIATLRGLERLAGETSEPYALPGISRTFPARAILRDRDGGLWIGTTDRGVVHVHQGRTDVFGRADGLSADFVETLFEDREGDIWVATIDGLDRFHDLSVHTLSVGQGLSNPTVESVLAARDGAVWLGTMDGLDRWQNNHIDILGKKDGLPDSAIHSLFQDSQDRIWVSTLRGLAILQKGRFVPVPSVPGGVQSIIGDRDGTVWVSQNENLYHISNGSVVECIPWSRLGHHDYARAATADLAQGGLWLGFRGGVEHYNGGRIQTTYRVADGLGEGRVRDLRFDRDGALWVSTQGGVSRVKGGAIRTLNSKDGLPCDDALWVMEEEDRSLWIYMACGLAHVSRAELDRRIASGGNDPKHQMQVEVMDASDGVRSHSSPTGYSPAVSRSADGRLWFLPWDGVSTVDGGHLAFNNLPPPLRIEQVTADHKSYDLDREIKGRLELPSRVRDLEIDYTALSLAAPEKVLFRYRLEPRDHEWHEVRNRRQAFYSDLSPGPYRFRVSACNNSGVWNDAGAYLDFNIAPAYYQTTWFVLCCVAATLALLGAVYRLRLRQVEGQFNELLEERLAERTRIAQELHDTLLQGFVSASMQVHVAADCLPDESNAKPTLTRALQVMRQVIDEGRNAVRGLRSYGNPSLDLGQAFSMVQQEVSEHSKTSERVAFRVIVEGQQRPLDPLLRDDVYRIGREALINAFRHSRARHIEVALKYSSSQLSILVRDDGCGIEDDILQGGREGHWGLCGMRERASQIGARFRVCSSPGAGTEVELSVPAAAAFWGHLKPRLRLFGRSRRQAAPHEENASPPAIH